jgi:hypothetical protein
MQWLYRHTEALNHLDVYLAFSDSEVLASLNAAVRDKNHPMHQEAVCLLVRHHRFKALEMPEGVTETTLKEIQKKLNIPDVAMGIEYSHSSGANSSLTFLVKTRQGIVCKASRFSEIAIPSGSRNWIFIQAEYAPNLLAALEKQR